MKKQISRCRLRSYLLDENCHGGYEWDGVCLTVYMLYCLITAPFDLSLCNLIVFQSNMY